MSTTLTKENKLQEKLLALFSKACYLKRVTNENDKYSSAEESLSAWADNLSQDISEWKVIGQDICSDVSM